MCLHFSTFFITSRNCTAFSIGTSWIVKPCVMSVCTRFCVFFFTCGLLLNGCLHGVSIDVFQFLTRLSWIGFHHSMKVISTLCVPARMTSVAVWLPSLATVSLVEMRQLLRNVAIKWSFWYALIYAACTEFEAGQDTFCFVCLKFSCTIQCTVLPKLVHEEVSLMQRR